MTPLDFVAISSLLDQKEQDKVRLLAYYYLKTEGIEQFSMTDVKEWFGAINLPAPNPSRLIEKLKGSKAFVLARPSNTIRFTLHAKALAELDRELGSAIGLKSITVVHFKVLPADLIPATYPFLENLGKQINASYEHSIFDGCAVLMRRLLEILLILSFDKLGVGGEIRDGNGDVKQLADIIANAKSNKTLNLSRNSKAHVDIYRALGNFSAHKIYYAARKGDIEPHILEYRALVEELTYKSGVKKSP